MTKVSKASNVQSYSINAYTRIAKELNTMITKEQLEKYGIMGATEIVYNPSFEQLFEEEMKPELEGYERGQVSELGAVNVMTGIYTGRSLIASVDSAKKNGINTKISAVD